jgi:hypothetical protein
MRGCLSILATLFLISLVITYWAWILALIALVVLVRMSAVGVRRVHAHQVRRRQAIKDEAWMKARRLLIADRMAPTPDELLRAEVDRIIADRGEGRFIAELDRKLAEERRRQRPAPRLRTPPKVYAKKQYNTRYKDHLKKWD